MKPTLVVGFVKWEDGIRKGCQLFCDLRKQNSDNRNGFCKNQISPATLMHNAQHHMLYHGSKIAGLKTLKPFSHAEVGGESVVFATPDIRFALAMIHGTSNELDVSYFVDQETHHEEMYIKELIPEAFKLLEAPGILYTVEERGFISDSRLSHTERISTSETSTTSEAHYSNIFTELQKHNIEFITYKNVLPQNFFNRHPAEVAQALIGKLLVRKVDAHILTGMIVETEAYLSEGDAAAHGFKGKTKRNQSLYKEAGHAYVHKMRHHCLLDVVTEEKNIASSVLIRAIEPLEGTEKMKKLRRIEKLENLANGPGKLCDALHITHNLDGIDMTTQDSELYIADGMKNISSKDIATSSRIGISKSADMPLRFYYTKSSYVSKTPK